MFGFDGGAQIGLDLKYGLPGLDVGVDRTSDRTIQLSGPIQRYQGRQRPVGVGLVANRWHRQLQRRLLAGRGVVLSRELGDRGAIYLDSRRAWATRTSAPDEDDDSTVLAGIGARLRFAATAMCSLKARRASSGYDPGVTHD